MTCAERKDLLLLYAADALESAEREELRAHLASGCPTCAGSLAEARATLAQLAEAIAPVAPPPDAVEKLMMRVASKGKTSGRAEVRSEPRGAEPPMRIRPAALRSPMRVAFASALLAAAASVAITAGAFMYTTHDARSFWRSRNMNIATLTSDTQPVARGQVWWDQDAKHWRVMVVNLAPPAPGQEYELWFIPNGGKPIPSRTFAVKSDGSASVIVDVPDNVGPLAIAAITNEPMGGVIAPTGKIHLKGKFPDLSN